MRHSYRAAVRALLTLTAFAGFVGGCATSALPGPSQEAQHSVELRNDLVLPAEELSMLWQRAEERLSHPERTYGAEQFTDARCKRLTETLFECGYSMRVGRQTETRVDRLVRDKGYGWRFW